MKFAVVLLWCLSLVMAIPMVPVPDTEFNIDTFSQMLEEANPEGYFALEEAIYSSQFRITKRDEATIAAIIKFINKTDIIFTALDLLADHPNRIEYVANLTSSLIEDAGSFSLGSLGLNTTKIIDLVNVSAIINDVIDSGLIQSILDGILLDPSYTPVLVNITYNVIESSKFLLYYLFDDILAKRDVTASDIHELIRRANSDGSLGEFISNAIAAVLSSKLVGGIAYDTLNALNDTGVAVYVVKRFIATPKYLNMTVTLVEDIWNTGVINVTSIYSSLNFSSLLEEGEKVLNSDFVTNTVNEIVNAVLSGDMSSILSSLGKYASAVGRIITGLEDKGLFADLNSLIFPSSTLNVISTTKEKKVASADMTMTLASSAAPSSSSKAAGDALRPSQLNSVLIYGPSILFSGLLLL